MRVRTAVLTVIVMFLVVPNLGQHARADDALLSLGDFLGQVREKHTGYTGAVSAADGLELRSQESDLILAPSFFANAQWAKDEAPKLSPAAQGTETLSDVYNFGFAKAFTSGTQARLYYQATRTEVRGANPLFLPNGLAWDNKPVLEVTQPLWRNFFGRETRATVEAGKAQALASAHSERYRSQLILAGAEAAYWRLSAAREALAIQRESVERSKRIREWAERRVTNKLADESDFLQADAGVRLRTLELQGTIDEERSAAQAFNATRGLNSIEVKERLEPLSKVDVSKIAQPVRAERRQDVEAAFQASQATSAAAKIGMERNLPTFEVYGSLALNGHDSELSTAVSNSTKTTWPTSAVGLRFSAPLDIGLLRRDRAGYRREADSAAAKFERAAFEQDRDWAELGLRYQEAARRLELAQKVEEVQKSKYLRERERHGKGRTTIYLVLQFEQDYWAAQLIRLRTLGEILGIVAQMKTFGSN